MTESYEEILENQTTPRIAPGARHERICARLHETVHSVVARSTVARLLRPRTEVHLSLNTSVCPDLALVTAATGKLWLAAEIISSDDHRTDTVIKKELYEESQLPRLWMIDPRYDNVEVYHGTPHGLMLKSMLAGRDVLTEQLLPEFQIIVADLFA